MTKFALIAAGFASAIAAVPATTAIAAPVQAWQGINQRQANIDRRIDQGIRSGALNRAEAGRLRVQFRDLATLEGRYRRSGGGLTLGERRDLDRRFDQLSARVRTQKNDRQGARYR